MAEQAQNPNLMSKKAMETMAMMMTMKMTMKMTIKMKLFKKKVTCRLMLIFRKQ